MPRPNVPACQAPDSPSARARGVLLDDYTLTNAEVALRARSTPRQVAVVRYALVSAGLIPPSRHVTPPPPRFKPLPHSPPDLTLGACVGHPRPDIWTDPQTPEDLALARHICRWACPVTALCLEWSLSLPGRDGAIYAATTATRREAIRAQRAGRPARLHNAARTARRAAAREAAAAHQAGAQAS
jgi:hypothetical protein